MDQSHVADALRRVEGRHPFLDPRLVEHVAALRFRQGDHLPYRNHQRRLAADLLPSTIATRTENTDYQFQTVVRCRSFDKDLATFNFLRHRGFGPPDLPSMAARVLAGAPDITNQEVWMTFAALSTELWLSEEDSIRRSSPEVAGGVNELG